MSKTILIFTLICGLFALRYLGSYNVITFEVIEQKDFLDWYIVNRSLELVVKDGEHIVFEAHDRIFKLQKFVSISNQESQPKNFIQIDDGLTTEKFYRYIESTETNQVVIEEFTKDINKGVIIYYNGHFLCCIVIKYDLK